MEYGRPLNYPLTIQFPDHPFQDAIDSQSSVEAHQRGSYNHIASLQTFHELGIQNIPILPNKIFTQLPILVSQNIIVMDCDGSL
jgi:hypothetical protein